MRPLPCILLVLGTLLACQSPQPTPSAFDPLPWVDPFIGTGFHGHTFPGATLPFGMVQLSPDTRLPGWDASSGYHYSDSTLYGFSHTHLSGTGIGDMGDILFLPFTGSPETELLGRFSKDSEQARPGYYAVDIENYGVKAELTATLRTGMHRYTYPADQEAHLLIDLGHILQANWGHRSLRGEFEIVDAQTIKGMRQSSGWAHDHPVYFYARFSAPFDLVEVRDGKTAVAPDTRQGKELSLILRFKETPSQPILAEVGISSVSREGAEKNLVAENPGGDFEAIREQAAATWQNQLSILKVKSQDTAFLSTFYTALYHSMMAPMLAQDVDGKYRGMDKQIKQAQAGETQYTVFSLWDTFRAFHPLMTILQPKQNGAWMGSLLRMYEEGGLLPKWPLAANYTGTMVGYPATAVLADAMAKGLEGFDYELALEASVFASEYHPEVLRNITEPRAAQVMPKQLAFLNQLGFIPHDSITHSVSYGLECAYYDWCIAQMATQLGKDSLAALYRSRARGYQTYFDPEIGFMRGKMADGSWQTPFNPNHSDHDNSPFVEGNAWQWSWFVPHDVAGMAELLGGEAAFARKLDQLFTTEAEVEGENASADITGLIGQYAHGNEPSHHVIHFYNYLGQPWKTQEKIDQVLRELYAPTPAGISGNEDCGAMSAWYVLNALGFYQLSPGDPTYTLTRPLVDEAEFRLANGKTFRIEVQNNAPEHLYIQQAWLNGEALATPFFTHEQLMQGGELTFRMGADKKMATR